MKMRKNDGDASLKISLLASWGLWTRHGGIPDDASGNNGNHCWSHDDRVKITTHTKEEEATQKQGHKHHTTSWITSKVQDLTYQELKTQ